MSKVFFDHLIDLKGLDREIKKIASTEDERNELWQIVDEIVHHRALGVVLDKLPKEHHEEFLDMFSEYPHDESLIKYLKGKIGDNFEELIRQEIGNLAYEILEDFNKK